MHRVTLSFDNGPTPGVTEQVLDVLGDQEAPSTFFVVGEKLARPEGRRLVERAHAEGHWIGNHTWSHGAPLGQRTASAAAEEIERAQAEIGNLAHPARLFRPNAGGGHLDARVFSPAAIEHLTAGAYTCVLWNAVPRDWDDETGWLERAITACRALPWSVVVLHDLPVGCAPRLGEFIRRLRAEGFELRQDFPDEIVPIRGGGVTAPLDHLTSEPIPERTARFG